MKAVDLIISKGMAMSKAEARRIINRGDLEINGELVITKDHDSELELNIKSGDKIKIGRREFIEGNEYVIRFIDMGKQIYGVSTPEEEQATADLNFPRNFSFWNTMSDRFLDFDGEQSWSCWQDFEDAVKASSDKTSGNENPYLERCRGLCPAWVFEAKQ